MNLAESETFLKNLPCVSNENVPILAKQLEKRTHQIAEKRNQSYEESLSYLIFLLKQGWTAKQKNSDPL